MTEELLAVQLGRVAGGLSALGKRVDREALETKENRQQVAASLEGMAETLRDMKTGLADLRMDVAGVKLDVAKVTPAADRIKRAERLFLTGATGATAIGGSLIFARDKIGGFFAWLGGLLA